MTAAPSISVDDPAAAETDVLTVVPLDQGWELAFDTNATTPGSLHDLRFIPARVPGTVASALRQQGLWRPGDRISFDSCAHWFRCRFDAQPAARGEQLILRLGGIATLSEVWCNGESILSSESMFASHDVDITALVRDRNELLILCRPLAAAMKQRRRQQPSARWKTRVVSDQQLRWFRTTILGRAPGFAAGPEPVGPWRPVSLIRRRHVVIEDWTRHSTIDGTTGVVDVRFYARTLEKGRDPLRGEISMEGASAPVAWAREGERLRGTATIRIPGVRRWMPHTHGTPALYPLHAELEVGGGVTAFYDDAPVGFRSIEGGAHPAGFAPVVNGVSVFCRGVVWTPADIVSLAASPAELRGRLRRLRDGGLNMVRLAGTGFYESEVFHRLCDELGLLVWQDVMFANMDYPFEDPEFGGVVRAEAVTELSRLARHPSTAVICGNSEIEQQVGMLGLDAAAGRGAFLGEELPQIAERHCAGVPYLPSAPCGGDQPFRTHTGVANYFGVGAYLRPFEDARRAEVRFASECLAFANVPEPEVLEKMALETPGGISPTHPSWKRAVPRDAGVGWDFEDVRDHYFKLLYALDPAAVRYADMNRYWELSRMVSGEVMAEVFGEWRRPASVCAGGIILWGADLEPGAGWGILDSRGLPKAAYWFLRRALAPQAVWMTDEGLNGIDIHIGNDCPAPLRARLRIAFYRRGEQKTAGGDRVIEVPPHTSRTFGAEQIAGRFLDSACAYRFGPPGHDLIAASLYMEGDDIPFSQTFRFPSGRNFGPAPVDELGLSGEAAMLTDGSIEVQLTSTRFVWGVRVAAKGYVAADNYFGLEPGVTRRVLLAAPTECEAPAGISVSAINAEGRISVPVKSLAQGVTERSA